MRSIGDCVLVMSSACCTSGVDFNLDHCDVEILMYTNELGHTQIGQLDLRQLDPADVPAFLIAQNKIRTQLQRNFQADDKRGLFDRRQQLREAFQLVPKSFASDLIGRLTFNSNDPLTRLFRYKIATATRNEMLRILQRKLETI